MGLLDFLLGEIIPLLILVKNMTVAYLRQTDSVIMVVSTGFPGKISTHAATLVTDYSIRITMNMDSCNSLNK